MTVIGILLEPLDVLFFRDGKPFEPSTRAGGAWPVPQTLAGAVSTALLRQHGCDFDAFKQAFGQGFEAAVVKGCGEAQRWIAAIAVRGPWLARIESPARIESDSSQSPVLSQSTPAVRRNHGQHGRHGSGWQNTNSC